MADEEQVGVWAEEETRPWGRWGLRNLSRDHAAYLQDLEPRTTLIGGTISHGAGHLKNAPKQVRFSFVMAVLSWLLASLLIITAVSIAFRQAPLGGFVGDHAWELTLPAALLLLALWMFVMLVPARYHPRRRLEGVLALVGVTLCIAALSGVGTAAIHTDVFMDAAATAAVTVAVIMIWECLLWGLGSMETITTPWSIFYVLVCWYASFLHLWVGFRIYGLYHGTSTVDILVGTIVGAVFMLHVLYQLKNVLEDTHLYAPLPSEHAYVAHRMWMEIPMAPMYAYWYAREVVRPR